MLESLIFIFFGLLLVLLYREYQRLLLFIDELLLKLTEKDALIDKLNVENELLTFRNQVLAQNKNKLRTQGKMDDFEDSDTLVTENKNRPNLNTLAQEITNIKNLLTKKFPEV